MAKQLVNPIERHFEKGLVALAGLLLIGVIARFLATSPNKMELGGEPVTPATIDAKVAQKAAAIQQRIRDARAEVQVPEPLVDDFAARVAPLKAEPLPTAAPFLPPVPLVDQPGSVVGQYQLVKVVKLDKPAVSSGRSTFNVPGPSGTETVSALNWVTVSSVFNVKHQSEVQRRAYGARFNDVIYGPFELQRRQRRPDGRWMDDDWQTLESWPQTRAPFLPNVTFETENDRRVISKEVQGAIEKYRTALADHETQLGLLRPLMPTRRNGDGWSFPLLTSYNDVLAQDDEYLHPKDAPAALPDDRYGLRVAAAPSGKSESTVKKVSERLAEIEKMIQRARDSLTPGLAVDAHNLAVDILREEGISASDKTKAERVRANADQAEKDIKREIQQGKKPAAASAGTEPGAIKREKLPAQQVWAHDAKPGSVQPGQTYQYRVRAWVYNQLAGDAAKFAQPGDAAKLLVPGEWSDPSDPITVPPAVEFFVTADDEKREEAGIEVFQWYDGVWVKDRFKFTIGDSLVGESRQKVPSIEDPKVPDNALVKFDGNAEIVAIDFKYPYRDRKRGSTREGFKIGSPTEACVAAFVDETGRLSERIVAVDKIHPAKKAAADRVDSVWR